MRLRFTCITASFVSVVAIGCGSSDSPSEQSTGTSGSSTGVGGQGGSGGDGVGGGGGDVSVSSSASGSTGVGGSGAFVPADHPAAPQVVTLGGPVLSAPKVVAFTYDNDVNRADVDTFMTELAASSYWPAVTSEYGVGPLTVAPPIHLVGPAPVPTTDTAVVTTLQKNLTGANPAWGPPDPMAIYTFVFPEGSNVDNGCCTDFAAYHDEVSVGGTKVAYSIVCTCPGFDGPGISTLGSLTTALTHELVEAATDPFPQTDPAFTMTDDASMSWSLITQGEVADMCQFDADQYLTPADMNYVVQRSWSNLAAAAGKDPCVPESTPPDVYFNSVPVVSDPVTANWYFGPIQGQGVKIALGQTRTIDVQLFSTAPTSGPWHVEVFDYSEVYGGAPNLKMSFNTSTGSNGDVLKLTIKALKKDTEFGAAPFYIESTLGNASNLWMGVVGQ
jgi:hypothetical protein